MSSRLIPRVVILLDLFPMTSLPGTSVRKVADPLSSWRAASDCSLAWPWAALAEIFFYIREADFFVFSNCKPV